MSRKNKNKITLVFNMDEIMEDMEDMEEIEESPLPKKRGTPKPRPPPKRRQRGKLQDFEGSLKTIPDFIKLIDDGIQYKNINVPLLSFIREELVELNQLIGLDSIKTSIMEQLIFYLQKLHEGSDMYLNTVIYGPPGTGKTTVAKIIGNIFSKLKIIKFDGVVEEDNIFECARRDDLIGEYLGSTSVKTNEYLQMCLGGVIFLDEVYSLGNKEGGDSFAKEAIDAINLFLSEHKEECMMIVAGYKEEVDQCFFKYNEGLRRRFMWYHTIDPYTPEQLRDIFLSKITLSNWSHDEKVSDEMVDIIKNNPSEFKDNAGSIENFITLIKIKHSSRVLLLPEKDKKVITVLDLHAALKNVKKNTKQETFMSMYM
jgi:SpoVK/Ycf46/Vps4 family AAA+-type ATPase